MKIPLTELQARVTRIQASLRSKEIEGALLVQRADTLYFSGTGQNIHVYIPVTGQPLVMAYRDLERAEAESPWDVVKLEGMSKIPAYIQGAGLPLPKVLGLELDVLPVNQYENYRRIFADAAFVDISYEIRLQRAVKSAWELERLAECAQVQRDMTAYTQEILRPGMTEVELEGLLVSKARSLGHDGYVRMRGFNSEYFVGAVTAGTRATVGGYFDGPINGRGTSVANSNGASRGEIQRGEPVIVDLGTIVHGYQIDQTRVFSLGPVAEELRAAYEVAVKVEEMIRRALVPERPAREVYEEILAWVRANTPYEENFMGYGPRRVRFIGHGVGLDLDELPTISPGAKEVLQTGMVLAIEPKFVFPDLGAVGIEDTVVVDGNEGAKFISSSPRELILV